MFPFSGFSHFSKCAFCFSNYFSSTSQNALPTSQPPHVTSQKLLIYFSNYFSSRINLRPSLLTSGSVVGCIVDILLTKC